MDHYVDNSGSGIRNLGSILDELSTEVQNCRDSLNQTLPVHEDSWDIVRMVQPIEIALSQASIMFTHRHGTSRKTAEKIEDLNKKIIAFSERFDLPQLDDSNALLWEIHRELLERNNQLLLQEDKPFMCYCEEE